MAVDGYKGYGRAYYGYGPYGKPNNPAWVVIDDSQNPEWAVIDDSQTSNFSAITNSQNPSWAKIDVPNVLE